MFSARSQALDGVSWVQGGEVENAVGWLAACDRIGAVVCSLPGASLLAGAGCGLLSLRLLCLRREELCSVPQHGVHDDRETTRQSDAGLAHG